MACCSRAAEMINFRLIRSDSIARNFIIHGTVSFAEKLARSQDA